MSEQYFIKIKQKTRSVSGACCYVMTRCFKEGKYWYIESNPMGTEDKVGFDWGSYTELRSPPTESGRLKVTGKLKVI